LDVIPFFRYTGNNSAYVELGAKISNINLILEENSVSEMFPHLLTPE
jgi:hypothetical protein